MLDFEVKSKVQFHVILIAWEFRQRKMTIDKFLDATDREILQDAGCVTAEYAKEFAETEFEKYRVIQDRLFQSDFDEFNGELSFDSSDKE